MLKLWLRKKSIKKQAKYFKIKTNKISRNVLEVLCVWCVCGVMHTVEDGGTCMRVWYVHLFCVCVVRNIMNSFNSGMGIIEKRTKIEWRYYRKCI